MIKQSTHDLKFAGSNPPPVSTGRDKITKKIFYKRTRLLLTVFGSKDKKSFPELKLGKVGNCDKFYFAFEFE
jgi:hypothetical protein